MSKDRDVKRRDFITTALAGGLGLGLFIFSSVGEVFAAAGDTPLKLDKTKGTDKRKDLKLEKGIKPPKCQRKRNPKCGTFTCH